MNQTVQWLAAASAVIQAALTLIMLLVLWLGWTRSHRLGYLVLTAWAVTALFGVAMPVLFSAAEQLAAKALPTLSGAELLVGMSLVRGVVSSSLLITGFALLVFREPKRTTS